MVSQEAHARRILAWSRVKDWDALRLTACYVADKCQRDLGCPFLASCRDSELEYSRDILRDLAWRGLSG